MLADKMIRDQILELTPQQPPFRFVDEILEVNEERILGAYTFKQDEFFYPGHFPGYPVTPGVILIETMAQTGAVAHAIFHMLQQGMEKERIAASPTLFSLVDGVEFHKVVPPGQRVLVAGEKVFFRRGSFRSRVAMHTENGELVCKGILTGSGVKANG